MNVHLDPDWSPPIPAPKARANAPMNAQTALPSGAPKGHTKIAQGNALGTTLVKCPSPEGAAELVILPPPETAARIDRIKQYHAGCIGAFSEQMGYAFLCGLELNAAKAEHPHGQFITWREAFLPQISKSSVQRYMAFAEELQAKHPMVGNFKPEALQLTNGQLPEKEKAAVLKAVYEIADGKSLTQLYRDLGVIRQPTPAGGFRPDAKAVQAWLKEHHPELAGTKFNDLPDPIKKAFKKQYKPVLDPKLLAQSKRDRATSVLEDLALMLDEQEYKKFWDANLRTSAQSLFHDFHSALTKLEAKKPGGRASSRALTSKEAK